MGSREESKSIPFSLYASKKIYQELNPNLSHVKSNSMKKSLKKTRP